METQIKESLNALIAGAKTANSGAVMTEMERLDGWLAQDRDTLHPQLVHFLRNRSYARALKFLGGAADIPASACGVEADKS
jgi:hypothetical protein